ncbi:MAG TPA: glycosyltransferase family A protein [Gammaproteobacteria bacterium]|jgi:glycosyltransferase involved in cell wall biosynthesis
MAWFHRPKLSLVVIVYDMGREAPRTLRSLALPYQTGIAADDYEVIVVDNGSPVPLGEAVVQACGPQFRYLYIDKAAKSPAAAINQGVAMARGKYVGIFIDGARLASPGLLALALEAFRLHADPVVATLAWHLGPELQQKSVLKGYDNAAEDQLLESIAWPRDGYRLFEISVLAASSFKGYAAAPSESNALFLRRGTYKKLGGFDPAFDLPGGGLLNLDFFIRALERESPLVMLFGEGTFHQIHGGASTSAPAETDRFQQWAAQYQRIRGKPWRHPEKVMQYLGAPTHPSLQAAFAALPR